MRLLKKASFIALTLTTMLAVAACAPTQKKESTGGYIDDTVITTKVKSSLLADKSIKSTEISVETFKGRVQLSGFVTSATAANKAVEITRDVPGVRAVSNNLLVK